MRADHAVRHNAAVGALVGFAVADALGDRSPLPPVVCGSDFRLPRWTSTAEHAFRTAEDVLSRGVLDMNLTATGIVVAAIALAEPDTPPPLLADADAVLMASLVRSGLQGDHEVVHDTTDSLVERAASIVQCSSGYRDAIAAGTEPTLRPLVGALAGLRWGPAAVPAAWATGVHGAVGTRTYGLRQLRRLAERLMRLEAPTPPEPRRSLGPTQVAPRLWLSNLHAVPRFLATHPDGAVVSLCPTTGAFDTHEIRREFALHDAAGAAVNPQLSETVDETLATIAAFHAEGRDVLVHCHHGASRTGLVLRCWLVESFGMDADDATTEAQALWPKTSTWNVAFGREVARRAARAVSR